MPEAPSTPHLQPLMRRNFLEYASYVIVDRAIPDERDGLKPVQRRILATLFAADDGKFHKVANIIGETMKLHPHGDASIGEALVVLANKDYFVEKQGNFGNIITGHQAAAARYIECRLTPLARKTLFHPALTRWAPSYDGRRQEPVFLPAKLPVVLLLGTEGIAVGMATKILPHNLGELLAAQIDHLEGRPFALLPDFPQGGQMDVSDYAEGRGKVRLRAVVQAVDERRAVIREIPFSTTCESLIASIEGAIARGKVKVAGIQDFTTGKVEIELTAQRGVSAKEVILQLFAYTDCEVSVSANVVVISDRHPRQATTHELLAGAADRLRQQIGRELEHELGLLEDRKHRLTLEQIFIEEKIYRAIEGEERLEEVREVVARGVGAFAQRLVRPLGEGDVDRLLELHIRRISLHDVGRSRAELVKIDREMRERRQRLRHLTATTIAYLRELDREFGGAHPRRTKIKRFSAVDRRAIARQDLRVVYDPKGGFIGLDVRGGEHTCAQAFSEFDLYLAVAEDGAFRVLGPSPRELVGALAAWLPFDAEGGATLAMVWRDTAGIAWGKRVEIKRFVRGRAYRLMPGGEGVRLDALRVVAPGAEDAAPYLAGAALEVGAAATVTLVPARRRRGQAAATVDLADLPPASLAARGTKLATFAVGRVVKGRA